MMVKMDAAGVLQESLKNLNACCSVAAAPQSLLQKDWVPIGGRD